MSESKQDWMPRSYITGTLEGQEVVDVNLEPIRPGARTFEVPVSSTEVTEVSFTQKRFINGAWVEIPASVEEVCQASVKLFGWVAGKDQ